MLLVALACSEPPTDPDGQRAGPGDSSAGDTTSPPTPAPSTGDTATPPVVRACGELGPIVQLEGTGTDLALGLANAADGGVYVTGAFTERLAPGGKVTLDALGPFDGVLLRYAADGAFEWARQITSPIGAGLARIAVAPDGDVVAAGGFTGDVRFAAGEPDEIALTGRAEGDGALARFAADGSLEWVAHVQGVGLDSVDDVVVLGDGAVIAVGRVFDDVRFGLGQPNEVVLAVGPDTTRAGFVARFDADGQLAWAALVDGAQQVTADAAALDPVTGEVVVVGHVTSGAATFPGPAGLVVDAPEGHATGYVARWTSTGEVTAVVSAPEAQPEVLDVAADGSLVVAGHFGAPATFGAGEPNETTLEPLGTTSAFAARYAPDGTLVWAVSAAATQTAAASGVATAPDGGAVLVGHFSGELRLLGNDGTPIAWDNPGVPEVFLARFDAAGGPTCASRLASDGNVQGGDVILRPDGSYFVAGQFEQRATLAAGEPWEVTLVGEGLLDGFLGTWWF